MVIVNQALARELWPDGDPVGRQLYLGTSASTDPRPLQIVGVAADVHERTERPSDRAWFPTIYVPVAQTADGFNAYIVRNPMAWMIRTRVEPHTLAAAVKSELLRASGGLPVVNVRSMDEILSRSTARQDFNLAFNLPPGKADRQPVLKGVLTGVLFSGFRPRPSAVARVAPVRCNLPFGCHGQFVVGICSM